MTLNELSAARLTLAAVMPPNVFTELPIILARLTRLHRRLVRSWETTRRYQGRKFGLGLAPGSPQCRSVVLLADQALAAKNPLRKWYELGAALGKYRHDLFMENLTGELADFKPIALAARALPAQQRTIVRVLVGLAGYVTDKPGIHEATLVNLFVKHQKKRLPYKSLKPADHRWTQDAHMFMLDSMIQTDLQRMPEVAVVAQDAKPVWDKARSVLRVGEVVVRQVRRNATNVVVVLDQFQKHGWVDRIANPFKPAAIDRVSRMYEAVASLNDNLEHDLIRFHSDGTGGITWQRVDSPEYSRTPP